MRMICSLVAAVVLAGSHQAVAQQQIEWKQVVNSPKGAGLPAGVHAAILGIAPGDDYERVKQIAEDLAKEDREYDYHVKNNDVHRALVRDTQVRFDIPIPGSGSITATYHRRIEIARNLKGSAREAIYDNIDIYFSAPSSGNQVSSISRRMLYHNVNDQPRISEIIGSLRSTFGYSGQYVEESGLKKIMFQYDGGKPVMTRNPILSRCERWTARVIQQVDLPSINKVGNCDVVYEATFKPGLSSDHAYELTFFLSDNERAKANVTADYNFFQQYVNSLKGKARSAPKL